MSYTVTSTEKTNQSASEQETKAMLYLMNFRSDSEEIFYFVIDFFNDVTGVDSLGEKTWDVQSKANRNLYGKDIGKDLVTLYKNHLSDLKFTNYILFLGGVAESVINDSEQKVFNISNFTGKAKKSIFDGLKEAAEEKNYINNDLISDKDLQNFLSIVTFVIDDNNKSDHIKKIIQVNPAILPKDEYLNKIFDQIRDSQSSKKNTRTENITINTLMEFERYKKHLTSNEIKLMVLSRLVHKDGIKDAIPYSFMSILQGRSDIDIREFVEDCRNDIFRMLYDKNNAKAYWELFEEVYTKVSINRDSSVEDIYRHINKDKLRRVQFLNFNSAKYFISLVKDGLEK